MLYSKGFSLRIRLALLHSTPEKLPFGGLRVASTNAAETGSSFYTALVVFFFFN